MNTLERVKKLCKERGITVAKLEEELEIPKNTIYQWKRISPSLDKLKSIADYFNVSIDYLLGRTDIKNNDLTEKDERDIAKRMEKMRKDLFEGTGEDGLAFSGEPMSDEAKESLLEALEFIERQTTKINKKYIPYNKRKNQD
ncbi:helix-turn-helix domain-containing protein [Virgibacillus sp. AGTR]|uniref:helix-turn-helix domain-containing protein n=1 Tax=Virgibacillus sp. AGTR TaxID=2812055 RepID=UPI001D167C09|nr:helix-turn-helix transcriptional regulator [Virgibacillus sp. AGTR]MCC2250536.1 helix-turn-helix domain-containing protein [Virgibacillus sp. AGTR]